MIIGAAIAWRQYGARKVPREAPKGSFVTVAARRDLYGDALNESLLMRPGQWLTRLAVWFDGRGVDGLVNGTAAGVGGSSVGSAGSRPVSPAPTHSRCWAARPSWSRRSWW